MPLNFLPCCPAQLIKVSCALLSSAWYENISIPQCILCINRLKASGWFYCILSLWRLRNGVQSRSERKVGIRHRVEAKGNKERWRQPLLACVTTKATVRIPIVVRNRDWCFLVRVYTDCYDGSITWKIRMRWTFTDHELIPASNASLAGMQGSVRGSNVRYYPTWKHFKERN
jgi:hypothetical protein